MSMQYNSFNLMPENVSDVEHLSAEEDTDE
jgi:hypothetical protein